MSTTKDFATYVTERAALPGRVTCRKMFGEYTLYLDGKVVALLCDNQLYLKPTQAGRDLLERVHEAAPYPGARPHIVISDELEREGGLRQLLLATAGALARPASKRRAANRPKPGS